MCILILSYINLYIDKYHGNVQCFNFYNYFTTIIIIIFYHEMKENKQTNKQTTYIRLKIT